MKLRTVRRQRTFRLEINLPPLDEYAWDVINSIEPNDIQVVNPRNTHALDDIIDSSGSTLIDADATLSVPLEDWLAVGCQRIRWEDGPENVLPTGAAGMYTGNFDAIFGKTFASSSPFGQAVFMGQIILPREMREAYVHCPKDEKEAFISLFQFILAHELVHVFDYLKYLVPAFMDWRAFWKNILGEGNSTDLLFERLCDKGVFIDDYGKENELESIRLWWPSRAEKWFSARKLDWKNIRKNTPFER
jgi:hypothetical protein